MGWWKPYVASVGRVLSAVALVVAGAASINLVSLPVEHGFRHLSGRRFTEAGIASRFEFGFMSLGVLILARRAARPLS